jgi:eukaryotic-like serine/threonine-protein kinase
MTDAKDRKEPPSPASADANPTMPIRDPISAPSRPSLVREVMDALTPGAFDERYERRKLLGRGGIGEVHLCRDRHVGRDVAIKLLRPGEGSTSSSASRARFVREARVQGQLEHPTVVPVYDLGLTTDGVEFFTMKRIGGMTLEQILKGLRSGDEEVRREFPRNKLLGLFRQVCLAVEYAHARGVVHRDLKPSNIMVGDFGEVYLLDWGLAKVISQDGPAVEVSHEAETIEGQILGTLGYMAPEQLVGDPNVDARTDVYGLGTMLFEVLTLHPLHEGSSTTEIMRSTQIGAEARPSVRVPAADVPPELEEVCVRVTRTDRELRDLSAREIAEAIERHLEGDRDLELRRKLASRHVRLAEEHAARALAGGDVGGIERKLALQQAGRALALNPQSPDATAILMRLMVEPPAVLPPAVHTSVAEEELEEIRFQARFGALGYGLFLALLAMCAAALGVQSWPALALVGAPLLGAAVACAFGRWRFLRTHYAPWMGVTVAGLSFLSIAASASMFGALVFVPGLAVANLMALYVGPLRRQGTTLLALACLSIAVPFALEWAGVLPAAYEFRGDAIVIFPLAFGFPELYTRLALVGAALATVVLPGLTVWQGSQALMRARERAHTQAWQLQQLVPSEAMRDPMAQA